MIEPPSTLRKQITNLIRWLVLVSAVAATGVILLLLERHDVIHIHPEPSDWSHTHPARSAHEEYTHDHRFPAEHHH